MIVCEPVMLPAETFPTVLMFVTGMVLGLVTVQTAVGLETVPAAKEPLRDTGVFTAKTSCAESGVVIVAESVVFVFGFEALRTNLRVPGVKLAEITCLPAFRADTVSWHVRTEPEGVQETLDLAGSIGPKLSAKATVPTGRAPVTVFVTFSVTVTVARLLAWSAEDRTTVAVVAAVTVTVPLTGVIE